MPLALGSPESIDNYLEQVVYLLVVNLKERTVDVKALTTQIFIGLDLLEKAVDSTRDETCIILVRNKILEKGVLMLLSL